MRKRILSLLLVAVTLLTSLPANFLAATEKKIIYGDVNDDGAIDLKDDLLLKRYIAEQNPSGFHMKNADVNGDDKADFKDLLMLKKYLAEWEGIVLGPKDDSVMVTFVDGDRIIDTITTEKGEPLSQVPGITKSSKANAILLGYYTDKECTQPFYAENPVESDMTVYAKYQAMASIEELNYTSFALMDQTPDVSFQIKKVSGSVATEDAAVLVVKDGTDPVELSIADADGDGVYTVSAKGGFNEGASYELNLAAGWVFAGKDETIRTAAFSIKMDEVENLQMSDDITYIQDTDALKYDVAGSTLDVLTSKDVDKLSPEAENEPAKTGTFVYEQASELNVNDILCIYVGKRPEERKEGSELLDPAVYVKVAEVNGTTVAFTILGEDDQQALYEIPDNFPIKVEALPADETGTVNISGLDTDVYKMMNEEANAEGADPSAIAKAAINEGDFITLYVDSNNLTEDTIIYGEVTGYNAETGEITYKKTTAEAIENCMDLYVDADVDGADIVTEEEAAVIEQTVLQQLEESGFGEEAAFLLAELVTQTEGFQNSEGIRDFVVKDAQGNVLTEEQIELLNLGASFELSDDVKLKVELIRKGDQLHFDGGLQLAVGIEADLEVEVGDEGKIAIKISASFVEEVAIDPSVKGSIVKKKILGFIPVPIGVNVGSTIDVRNYTAFSFDAEIYTMENEDDKSKWDKIKDIMHDPTELLGVAVPEKFAGVLNNVGDVMDMIDELESKVKKANEKAEAIEGYKNDIEDLWAIVEAKGVTDRETWAELEESLGKTNVASDLLDLMDLTTETGITTEYIDTFQKLMDKYSETVQKETDWIALVEKEMFTVEVVVYGIAIGMEVDFIVRMDMSIAIGSNLEYEVGKRYNFWFEIGLFKPKAGSSTMDLIDERFAFQFYVMGRLGLRAGVEAEFYVGIGSGKLARVGITAELGPYLKLYGFFVYEYTKYRPANTGDWLATERMAGGMFLEFGLYFILGFEAQALGLFEYSHDFLDEEIPLLTAGDRKYYYDFSYEPEAGEMVVVRDEDGNSTNGITAPLRDSLIALDYVDLKTGVQAEEVVEYKDYIYTVSNENFSIDENTGIISVNVPENTRIMECDLTVTYKYGKLAFSQYDMSVTIPLVWTNLSDAELSEYYTASVRVGNDVDGYETVWSTRILKNQQFDLPTAEEIKELIGWNDAKYAASTGYGNQALEGLTLIEDEVYDFKVDYKTYSITVNGIQNKDGSTTSKTFTAKYGESFDFSGLAGTGTYKAGETYTKFAGVTTTATITVNGEKEVIDLSKPINGKMAEALTAGITATAEYVDNSASLAFIFAGGEHEDVTMKIAKGEEPDTSSLDEIAAELGLTVKEISPVLGKVYANMNYIVTLGEIEGDPVVITFEENGGSEVNNIEKVPGSLVGKLPTPVRTGYTFDGWYTDSTCQTLFESKYVPEGGITLYAKWIANTYTVNFHVNGGNALAEEDAGKKVTYGSEYGTFPAVTKTGYGFVGWFTAIEGGTQVKESDIVTITETQTLYARWKELKEIPNSIFDFGDIETVTYEKGKEQEVLYTFTAEDGETYKAEDFTFKYMKQGAADYAEGLPINAGTYNVTVSRAADNDYAKFEYTYTAVITINKAIRLPDEIPVEVVDAGYTYLDLKLAENAVDDLSPEATVSYEAVRCESELLIGDKFYSEGSVIYGLEPNTTYCIVAVITNDPNYEDTRPMKKGEIISTKAAPTDSWLDEGNYDISWYNAEATSYEISTAAQLAGVSYILRNIDTFSEFFMGKTITLTADIDLSGHAWIPIVYFFGTFDGGNHTITGVYVNNPNSLHQGLFGILSAVGGSCNVEIKNICLEDSYIYGSANVGGIVGYADAGVGIVPTSMLKINISNCVSYAVVKSKNGGNDDSSAAGGIVGNMDSSQAVVENCENYGSINGTGYHVGGIVGYTEGGKVHNCANYGTVYGSTACVGGIVGESVNGQVYNSISLGSVSGDVKYIGAIVGRNTDNDGTVEQCYYLKGSADARGDNKERTALGTKKGALADGDEGTKTSSFTTSDYALKRDCGYGKNLLDALNAKATEKGWAQWEESPNGYPVLKGLIRR